jgi:DNA-binding CsgD family transcriptional regulator
MNDKFTQLRPNMQVRRLPAGILPGDSKTELFGDIKTRKVYGIRNGATIPFDQVNPSFKVNLYKRMLEDSAAMEDLRHKPWNEALEEFAFCLYGAADHSADILSDGTAGPAENFMCSTNCRCLAWKSKNICIDGNRLTFREIQVTRLLATDKPDKEIAMNLGISPDTLSVHKRMIYEKAGVQSKAGLVTKACLQGIIQ